MKYFFQVLIVGFYLIYRVLNSPVEPLELMIFLIFLCSNIYRSRFKDLRLLKFLEVLLVIALFSYDKNSLILLGIIAVDTVAIKKLYEAIALYSIGVVHYLVFKDVSRLFIYVFYMSLCLGIGFLRYKVKEINKLYKELYDKERRQIYELETTKQKLLNSSKDLVHLTEIKERNRIAREIHDNIGHSIAGILMQLQASRRILGKNDEKAYNILDNSIDGLARALNVIRDTVHNIKPKERMGLQYIQELIRNFSFCDIDFKYSGDFNSLPTTHLEIMVSNIKEALTNASKYSRATKVNIRIDVNEAYSRLLIKDNGIGCNNISEGLGLSGMKERIKNLGGSISISSEDGFMIVCVVPREEGSVKVFDEGSISR